MDIFAYEEEIKDISANMARDIADAGKKTIAVADFTDLQGNVPVRNRVEKSNQAGKFRRSSLL